MKPMILAIVAAACAPVAADLVTVDILSGAEPGAPTPAGILSIDVFVDIDATDTWTAAGIRAVASNGALIRYAGQNVIINPGLTGNPDRNVVALSKPQDRDSVVRFFGGGAADAGSYIPGAGPSISTPAELNVVFFASPPATPSSPSVDGYIARIGLDVSVLGAPNSAFAIFTPGSQPAGAIPVLVSAGSGNQLGTVFATFDAPAVRGINWGVYLVPAPGTVGVLGVAGIVAMRRRRDNRS
jgi:hypothetical protein